MPDVPDTLNEVDYIDAGSLIKDTTTYQYNNPSCPYGVTGVFDFGGVQRWGVTYDPATCQATSSSLSGAAIAGGTGSISGNTMTVSALTSGTFLVGQAVTGAGIPAGMQITGLAGGTGGVGAYTVYPAPASPVGPIALTGMAPGAVVQGSISGSSLTVTSVTSGTLVVGQTIVGPAVAAGTTITGGPATGGIGTYTVNNPQTVGAATLTALAPPAVVTGSVSSGTLTVTGIASGALAVGNAIIGPGVPAGIFVTALGPGASGGVGSYTINNNTLSVSAGTALTGYAPPTVATGSISAGVLTVTNLLSGWLSVGEALGGMGVAPGTVITGAGSGAGGPGTYTVNVPQTAASATLTGSWPPATATGSISGNVMTITGVASGAIGVGQMVSGQNVAPGAVVTSWGTGNGGAGVYTVSTANSATSTTLTTLGAAAVKSYQVAYDPTPAPGAGGMFNHTVTNPLGKVSVYTFSNNATFGLQLTSIVNQASPLSPASSEVYAYGTSDGFVSSHTDKNTVTETFESPGHLPDPRGMPTQTVEGASPNGSTLRTTNYSWNPLWRQPDSVTAQTTLKTNLKYNDFGAVTKKTLIDQTNFTTPYPTNGRTRVWNYDWNASNQLTAVHGPLWVSGGKVDTTSFGYNSQGYLATINRPPCQPLCQTTTITSWDWRGAPLATTDPNGVSTAFQYDIHGRLTQAVVDSTGAAPSTYQFAYDAVGDLAKVTLPMGATLNYQYDAGQRLVTVTNTRNETRTFTWDNDEDPLSLTTKTSAGATTQVHSANYDEWGRILQSVGAASQIWKLTYDNLDNLTSVTDPPVSPNPGRVRAYLDDALNRLVKQTDPEMHFVQFGYDLADVLNQLTDARSVVTNRVVDGFGEVIQEASPDRGTLTYYYDAGGNLTKRLDGGGTETDFAYDAANRLISRCWPSEDTLQHCVGSLTGGPGQEIYTYDQTSGGNAGVGRLTSVTDEAGSTTLIWDAQGRVTKDARVVTGVTPALAVSYAYDLNGKVLRITYPSGDAVDYARTTDGLITGVTFTPNGGSPANIATNVAYEPFGPLTTLAYGNGLNLTRTYDQDYRLTGVAAAPNSGPAVLNLGFGWQADGRIASVSGTNVGAPMAATYSYTPAGRVLTANGPWGNFGYGYDASGNLTQTGPATAPLTVTVSPSSNRLVSTAGASQRTFTFGADGDLTVDIDHDPGATNFQYVYNAADRLVAAQIYAVAPPVLRGAWAYDFSGRRVWRQTFGTGGAKTAYAFDEAGHVLAEASAPGGATSQEYIWLDERLIGMATFSGSTPTLRFVTTGQIDEPLLVTSADQSAYWNGYVDPYGTAKTIGTALTGLNLRLPGQWFQAEASNGGLSQNGWRDYDPSLGRYIEADPLGIDGGANVFPYVGGDPLNRTDPQGLFDPRALSIAERLALAEEIGGGGPEDPFADAAAIATLGAGFLASELTPDPTQRGQVRCKDNRCQVRYAEEESRCFALRNQGKILRADLPGCISRAQNRLRLCIRNGYPAPDNEGGPYEWAPRNDGQRYRRLP